MKISIDGREITFEGRPTLLELARANGISVPSLCDQPGLRPFTGCRLCLVEIAGRRDYAPACGTYPEEGMSVRTSTPELQALRRSILELILVEHPHACLVCAEKAECLDLKATLRKAPDVTGCLQCPADARCALQEVVRAVGLTRVRFPATFRNLAVRRDDPFIDRDPNLCILCGKCVRVCENVRGAAVLSFAARGSETVVSAAYDRRLLDSDCRFCGACVDVCPTGALGERALRNVPAAENVSPAVCPFCAQGCRLEIETRAGGIRMSRPSSEGPVNRGQACVKGRFLVRELVHAESRLRAPAVRRNGRLVPAGWDEAIDAAAAGLARFGPGETAVVVPAQASLEDAWVFLRFGREVLKTAWIAFGDAPSIWDAWAGSSGDSGKSGLPPFRLRDIGEADAVVVIGADLADDHPIAWLEAVRAASFGARIVFAGTPDHGPLPKGSLRIECAPGAEDLITAALCREVMEGGAGGRKPVTEIREAADVIRRSRAPVILVDGRLAAGPRGSRALARAWNLARLTGGRFMPLGRNAGERGIFELARAGNAGARTITARDIVRGIEAGAIKAVYLAGPAGGIAGVSPEFIVCQDSHACPAAAAADVLLPAATFAETGGTFVNTEGRVQSFGAVIALQGMALPDWRILSRLGRGMGIQDFGFDDIQEVIGDIVRNVPAFRGLDLAAFASAEEFISKDAALPPGFLPVGPSAAQGPGAGGKHGLSPDASSGASASRSASVQAGAMPGEDDASEDRTSGSGLSRHACRSFDPTREVRGFGRIVRRKA